MSSKIDKKLENRRKEADGDYNHLSKWCNNFWKIAWKHPLTILIVFIFVCFGYYYDWNYKNMVSVSFSHGITSLLTGLIQYLFFQSRKKKD